LYAEGDVSASPPRRDHFRKWTGRQTRDRNSVRWRVEPPSPADRLNLLELDSRLALHRGVLMTGSIIPPDQVIAHRSSCISASCTCELASPFSAWRSAPGNRP